MIGCPTGRGGNEEWIDAVVPCGEHKSEQPSIDVWLIDDEDVVSTGTGVEDRVQSCNELMAPLEGFQSDLGSNAEEKTRSEVSM